MVFGSILMIGAGSGQISTNTQTNLTPGSVFFAGTNTVAQDNTNFFWDNAQKFLGIGTNTPQSALTLGAGSSFTQYNTTDVATNYARLYSSINTSYLQFRTENAGTEASRALRLGSYDATLGTQVYFAIANSGATLFNAFASSSTTIAATSIFRYASPLNGTSAAQTVFVGSPNVTQTSTASYIIYGANPTETTIGSGQNYFALWQISGTTKFSVQTDGLITHANATLLKTSVALTNGAASAAGTLLNAPVAGNPTKWVPINDNGTVRYIPAW